MRKRVASILVNLLCVVAIAVSLLAGWAVFTTPRGEAPKLFGCYFMTVLTGSMEPGLPQGSLIIVRETDAAEVAVGDVISFYTRLSGQKVVNTHRVAAVTAEGFTTKGDANPVEDAEIVTADQMLGRVVWQSNALGQVVSQLHNPYVFFPVVLILLGIVIFSCIRHIVRLGREEVARAQRELTEEDDDDGQKQ